MARLTAPLIALAALLTAAPAALADDGGTTAPDASGGSGYRQRLSRLVPERFAVTRAVRQGGEVRFAFRVDGASGAARVRIALMRERSRRTVLRIDAGVRRTGRLHVVRRPLRVRPGRYVARLRAVDAAGRTLARTATASSRAVLRVLPPLDRPAPAPVAAPAPAPVPAVTAPAPPPQAALPLSAGVFPVQGTWSFGGDDGRFGADRGDHVHMGQDIVAAEGTPLVAPRAGTIVHRAYQADGAGHYIVLRADDGRDYVYMHLREASPLAEGTPVAAGQPVGVVGTTGSSSGPHLHFEIWPSGWYAKGSRPVDPRAQLEAWAAL